MELTGAIVIVKTISETEIKSFNQSLMSNNKKGSPKSTKSRSDCYITNETNFRSQHRYITEALSICRYHNFFSQKEKATVLFSAEDIVRVTQKGQSTYML
jgi:hypothetical protein